MKLPLDWGVEPDPAEYRIPLGSAAVAIQVPRLPLPDWLPEVIELLNVAANLPPDWDSYGARPANQRSIERAFQILFDLMPDAPFVPRIWATVRGGVEIEWHDANKSLELDVEGPFHIHAYFSDDSRPDEEWEDDIVVELNRIRDSLKRF